MTHKFPLLKIPPFLNLEERKRIKRPWYIWAAIVIVFFQLTNIIYCSIFWWAEWGTSFVVFGGGIVLLLFEIFGFWVRNALLMLTAFCIRIILLFVSLPGYILSFLVSFAGSWMAYQDSILNAYELDDRMTGILFLVGVILTIFLIVVILLELFFKAKKKGINLFKKASLFKKK